MSWQHFSWWNAALTVLAAVVTAMVVLATERVVRQKRMRETLDDTLAIMEAKDAASAVHKEQMGDLQRAVTELTEKVGRLSGEVEWLTRRHVKMERYLGQLQRLLDAAGKSYPPPPV